VKPVLALCAAIAVALLSGPASAADTESEIEYLLTSIGTSGCEFVRNGKTHSAEDAEAHLRMKYKRGKRYAKTTEQFIERLASASSMTKRPYEIRCGGEAQRTGDWLKARLGEFRSAPSAAASEAS
jgi:hypothetical protein